MIRKIELKDYIIEVVNDESFHFYNDYLEDMLGDRIFNNHLKSDHNYNFNHYRDGMELEEDLSEVYEEIIPITVTEHSQVFYFRGTEPGWDNSFIGFLCFKEEDLKKMGEDTIDEYVDRWIEVVNMVENNMVYQVTIYKKVYNPDKNKIDKIFHDSIAGILDLPEDIDELGEFLNDYGLLNIKEDLSNLVID